MLNWKQIFLKGCNIILQFKMDIYIQGQPVQSSSNAVYYYNIRL